MLLLLAATVAVSIAPPVQGVQADATTDALLAKRAQLVAELAAMSPARDSANSALNAAEAAYNTQQAKLLAMQQQIDNLNAQLQTLGSEISTDEAVSASARLELGKLTRATYETSQNGSLVAAILSSSDFATAMSSLATATHFANRIEALENVLTQRENDLQVKRQELKKDFAEANALQGPLQDASNQLLALVEQRNLDAASLNGPAREIAAEIAQIDYELAGGGSTNYGSGTCGDRFAFGQCTYYVATRRCIPWGGNADEWFYNAAKMGYQEGHEPQPGAVAIWWPYAGGASSVGHVAYVEAVGPTNGIPAGYFEVSEMNWTNGWDRVDYRVVQNSPSVFQGFIYGHP